MLTLFSTCKPFSGLDDIHQRNAIRSWLALEPRPEIVLIGPEAAGICVELGLKHVPNVTLTSYGKPDVRAVFEAGIAAGSHDLLVYVNADIILLPDFMTTVQRVAATYLCFLMSGQRWNVDIENLLTDFDEARKLALWTGTLLPPTGMDYFVFRRGMFADLARGLGMGHLAWDNYLPWYAVHKDNAVFVNTTRSVTAIHQNHPVPELGDHHAAQENHRIVRAQDQDNKFCGLTLLDAKLWDGHTPHQGRLFGDKVVSLDPRTVGLGGAWWQRTEDLQDALPVASDDHLVRLIWEHIKDHPAPVVIDVGASTGMVALLAAHLPRMTGIAFEPHPEAFAVLNQNIWLNNLQARIQARAVAVGETSGMADLYITKERGMSGLNTLGFPVPSAESAPFAVPVVTLDSACADMVPTVIKVDVEHNELDVIRGAAGLIQKHHPLLVLECPEDATITSAGKCDELRALLRRWGATVTQIDTGNIMAQWGTPPLPSITQNNTVSIVIPSLNRPERVEAAVKRILEVTPYQPLEVIVVIDLCTDSRDRLLALHDPRVQVLFNAERKGAIACWNQGLGAATGDILCFWNDDCSPEPGWLEAALKAHRDHLNGYGVCGFNDGYQDGNVLAVQYLFDRQFCIDHLGGVMAYPCYSFSYNDTEANARAKLAGRFYWCKESMVQHNHWSRPGVGRGPDELNQANMNLQGNDGFVFEERKVHGFPNNFEPVIKRGN